MSNIVDTFERTCLSNLYRPAIVFESGGKVATKTFGELHHDVSAVVSLLIKNGVRKDDRILAFAPSSYRLCVFMLAALKIGASIMYVDIFAKQEKLKTVLENYKPDCILVSNKTRFVRVLFPFARKIKKVFNVDSAISYKDEAMDLLEVQENTLALLTMTTGSTGRPKIVTRTHEELHKQLLLINRAIDKEEATTVLTTSYMYVFANILNGFTTVLPCINLGKQSPRKINRKLKKFAQIPINMIITSPDFCLKAENTFSELKTLYFGGAILNLNEAKVISKKFDTSDNWLIYGSTECNIISKINLKEYIEALNTSGRSLLGYPVTGVKIATNEKNEILVSSEALLEHYLVSDYSNKKRDADGALWHNTGDAGVFVNNIIEYRGRSKFFVCIGDEKIYTNQIEQRLIVNYPEIKKCAILQSNNTLYVFVQTPVATTAEQISCFFKNNYGVKDVNISFIKSIPCDVKHHTKINYSKLLKKIERGIL